MDINTIAAIIFLVFLSIVLFIERKKLDFQPILFFTIRKKTIPIVYFIMYKTKWGVQAMDSVAKRWKGTVKWFGYIGIGFGFLGMLLMSGELIRNVVTMFITEQAIPGVGVVLPIQAKGVFFVPFIYWIISIFQIASVHEFAHGVVAKRFGMRIKNSGLAFLGIIIPIVPAAFVEPDDKQMAKKPHVHQHAMFAAGPFINILLGIVFFLLLVFVMLPVVEDINHIEGVEIVIIADGEGSPYPAEQAGLELGDVITTIDGVVISDLANFTEGLSGRRPGENVRFTTTSPGKESLSITLDHHPDNESKGYLGLSVVPKQDIKPDIKERYGIWADAFMWFSNLLFFLFLLNLGIGLFNLLPMGPVDGGRMTKLLFADLFGEKKGHQVWKWVSWFFFIILLILLGMSFFG